MPIGTPNSEEEGWPSIRRGFEKNGQGRKQALAPGSSSEGYAFPMDNAFQHDIFLMREKNLTLALKVYVEDEQGQPLLFIEGPVRHYQALFATGFLVLVVLMILVTFAMGMGDASHNDWILVMLFLLAGLGVFGVLLAGLAASRRRRSALTFYRDADNPEKLCDVTEERWSLFKARYKLRDASGISLGIFLQEPMRWRCEDTKGRETCRIRMKGVLRRHYVFESGGKPIGFLDVKPGWISPFHSPCILDLSSDARQNLDRRLALAVAAMLTPRLARMYTRSSR